MREIDGVQTVKKIFLSLLVLLFLCACQNQINTEHVWITSVPELAAKPIVDMDVVVSTQSDLRTTQSVCRSDNQRRLSRFRCRSEIFISFTSFRGFLTEGGLRGMSS
ncbi:GrpB family protein [Paenibacillus sp. Soil750]|uniref:GrpB family protein n=1 Tax=Paenibacillus sp. Soil750 TaxID=1736398 RepID=UPI0009EBE59E|nr:GrpB family protein [Paenibacillus sp. Soil750]